MPPLQQQPRYIQLAQTLIAEIEAGLYPVGALIPTELDLCEQFGASRFTVREAIKRLVQLGMVVRQAGVGTRVLGPRREIGYSQIIESLSDLSRFTSETTLEILHRKVVEVSGETAEALQADPGEAWLFLEALRRTAAATPLALSHIYIHPAFRGLDYKKTDASVPIYIQIEQQFGEQIMEVRQTFEGMVIDSHAAHLLGVERGSAALRVTRVYVNRRGEMIEMAINTHPADRYSYSQTFRRDEGGGLS